MIWIWRMAELALMWLLTNRKLLFSDYVQFDIFGIDIFDERFASWILPLWFICDRWSDCVICGWRYGVSYWCYLQHNGKFFKNTFFFSYKCSDNFSCRLYFYCNVVICDFHFHFRMEALLDHCWLHRYSVWPFMVSTLQPTFQWLCMQLWKCRLFELVSFHWCCQSLDMIGLNLIVLMSIVTLMIQNNCCDSFVLKKFICRMKSPF